MGLLFLVKDIRFLGSSYKERRINPRSFVHVGKIEAGK
jgi:hypothetical protein